MTTVSDYFLDNFISVELSKVDSCDAEDIQYDGENLPHLILNHAFRCPFPQELLPHILNYIWRIDQAIEEYRAGRKSLLTLAQNKHNAAMAHYPCLYHFLQSASLLYQARNILASFLKFTNHEPLPSFKANDGSHTQRLNAVHNAWKHSESRLEKGELPLGGSLPVWLVKSGLRTVSCELTFDELRGLLLEYLATASWLANDLPNEMVKQAEKRGDNATVA